MFKAMHGDVTLMVFSCPGKVMVRSARREDWQREARRCPGLPSWPCHEDFTPPVLPLMAISPAGNNDVLQSSVSSWYWNYELVLEKFAFDTWAITHLPRNSENIKWFIVVHHPLRPRNKFPSSEGSKARIWCEAQFLTFQSLQHQPLPMTALPQLSDKNDTLIKE